MKITSQEIREKFLEFFKEKKHEVIPSAPVVPENDPTVLFTTAGMHPLVPYLLGEDHPKGRRLTNFQKCVRTGDIDEVGDNSHGTFFEMLGNWSLGDYFKKDSIAWSYEFLTSEKWLGLDSKKIAVTVFEGDKDAPKDEESSKVWESVGISKDKISFLPKSENWWGPAGKTGPCGPDTEIFYWVGESEFPPAGSNVKDDEDNWMEIWNNVFMEYIKDDKGNYKKAKQKNVDTGMGLERVTAILNDKKDIYSTDIFSGIIKKISKTLKQDYGSGTKSSMRIIADHIRTAVFMIGDGVLPSNVEQGYVLRRLIRRAIREAYKLDFKGQFLKDLACDIIDQFGPIYPGLVEKRDFISDELDKEESQFISTLEKGLKEFAKLLKGFDIAYERTGKKIDTITGTKAFKLYDTYGFPLEMTIELATENNLQVDEQGFKKAFGEHQDKSRAGSEKKFQGGLADDSDATTALHSATHLLLAGLRKVLGAEIHQKGSNITADRLRFDFNYPWKVEREMLNKIEAYVNNAIQKGCEVHTHNMPKKEAQELGVEGSFWEKYPDVVKVYSFESPEGEVFSHELCGGPHVTNTNIMGKFVIKKEQSSSKGVRRIKAVLIKD